MRRQRASDGLTVPLWSFEEIVALIDKEHLEAIAQKRAAILASPQSN
jgi:hypothetical protein